MATQIFFIFTLICGEMIQFDEHIFQVGGSTTNWISTSFWSKRRRKPERRNFPALNPLGVFMVAQMDEMKTDFFFLLKANFKSQNGNASFWVCGGRFLYITNHMFLGDFSRDSPIVGPPHKRDLYHSHTSRDGSSMGWESHPEKGYSGSKTSSNIFMDRHVHACTCII